MGNFAQVPHGLLGTASPYAIALYAALHRHSTYTTGVGSASRRQLMEASGITTERRFYATRKWLMDEGWLVITDTGGGRTPCRYALPASAPEQQQVVSHNNTSRGRTAPADGAGEHTTTEGVQSSPQRKKGRARAAKVNHDPREDAVPMSDAMRDEISRILKGGS